MSKDNDAFSTDIAIATQQFFCQIKQARIGVDPVVLLPCLHTTNSKFVNVIVSILKYFESDASLDFWARMAQRYDDIA
jgi:hypothetical protein